MPKVMSLNTRSNSHFVMRDQSGLRDSIHSLDRPAFHGCIPKHALDEKLNFQNLVLSKRERRVWISVGSDGISDSEVAKNQLVKSPLLSSRGEYLVITPATSRTKGCAEFMVQCTK